MDITRPPDTDILVKYVFELRRTWPNYWGKKFHQHTVTLNEYFFPMFYFFTIHICMYIGFIEYSEGLTSNFLISFQNNSFLSSLSLRGAVQKNVYSYRTCSLRPYPSSPPHPQFLNGHDKRKFKFFFPSKKPYIFLVEKGPPPSCRHYNVSFFGRLPLVCEYRI